MSMSRRHFQKIANALRVELQDVKNSQRIARDNNRDLQFLDGRECAVSALSHALADMCASENPNFDRNRFLAACQPK